MTCCLTFISHPQGLTLQNGPFYSLYDTAGGDYEKIWNEHCEDEVSLGEYAYAMQHLAQEHWSAKHADDRIKWCHDACIEYFFQGGMKTVLDKDRRRREHHRQRKEESRWLCNGSTFVRNLNGNSNGNNISSSLLSSLEEFHQQYFDQTHPLGNRHNAISLPFSGQLRLLDVGSCFNPFLEYDEFLAVGIDISPAVESVHKCDFLNLQIQQPLQVAPDTVNRYLRTLKSPVETLPRECFHVIVFSLLLSYFPSPYQRWICCQKAHQLLQMNGLLLIITPDSSHQNRNAGMVKSWRTAIESLGFTRWRYRKDTHMHYMAFRKTSQEPPGDLSGNEVGPDMLYIPQDFNEEVEESVFSDCLPKTEAEIADLSEAFNELPSHFVDDLSELW
ncbi:S-adenosylmethionine sensor upstream of mTORC1-like [Lytechinus variegatus]|uniref:S-adenosylmethionine sensor upstream of mTORC1-like n=1 Tax=Lytechinus variegatus TaxID=7654 RepID=UPI001BB12ADB|nr:S-adenosylmethionine sensor upstream of mTORC1-like [Lytechinus variegatus]